MFRVSRVSVSSVNRGPDMGNCEGTYSMRRLAVVSKRVNQLP